MSTDTEFERVRCQVMAQYDQQVALVTELLDHMLPDDEQAQLGEPRDFERLMNAIAAGTSERANLRAVLSTLAQIGLVVVQEQRLARDREAEDEV